MKPTLRYLPWAALCLALAGCYKDEVDPAAMNDNPFDPEYAGPPVFGIDSTALVEIDAGGITLFMQDFHIRVHEHLFLAPAAYSVQVVDQHDGTAHTVSPTVPGHCIYRRAPVQDEEVCLELRLMNSASTSRPETHCATL
ncbi:MAG: hypothetical protein RBT71_12425 [Flavobacteriales bacterium]|jgi:hypothetical protein|nr:hypothetical protein [Flavobacteriales bacterium]